MELYLGAERSGVAWLLDPASPRLATLAKELAVRTPQSPCDPAAVAADLAELGSLMRQRHFGLATGVVTADPEPAIDATRQRVLAEQPATWGDALGDLADQLRTVLRDRHLQLRGSPPSRLRADEAVCPIDREAPAVEVVERHGVLCVTIRRFWGGPADDAALWAFAAASEEHFQHQRIVVDLRGNDGGNDAIVWDWMAPALAEGVEFPLAASGWCVGETPVGLWNPAALIEAEQGIDAVPSYHRAHRHTPSPGDTLTVRVEPDDATPAGARPWDGTLLVLVDGATKSSGESAMWMLRHGLRARVAGHRTAGMLEFGNIAPYLLPHAGLHVALATKRNDFGEPMELTGFPVDVELDVRTPLEQVAADFDAIARSTME
jgi:hypothetical protein